MKTWFIAIMAICTMVVFSMPLQAQDADTPSAPELSLEEVLNKHYEALGGLDKIKGVQSAKMMGIINIPAQGIEFPFTRSAKRPNKLRMDSPIQGMDIVQACDGETAWWIMPPMGAADPQPMPDIQAQSMIENAYMDGALIDYETKGNTIELGGVELVDDKPAYKLNVTLANGGERTHFIDSESFLEVKITGTVNQMGQDMEVNTYFEGYQEIDGMQVWHHMKQEMMGQTSMELTIETLEFNVEMDDALFSLPANEPDPPADGGTTDSDSTDG